jgi:hypothetical protein
VGKSKKAGLTARRMTITTKAEEAAAGSAAGKKTAYPFGDGLLI